MRIPLFESMDQGVCLFEPLPPRPDGLRDYRYIAMNPAMQSMFGMPDLSGQSIRDNFPDEVEDWYDDYDSVLATGRPIRFERESQPQGKVLEMFVARVDDDAGTKLLAVIQDITARRRAEDALRASERRLSNMLSGMDECFGLMNRDLRIITQNESALRLDGRPLEAIRGRTHAEVYPDANPELERLYRHALADNVHVTLEHRHTWPGGAVNWLEMRAYPVPEGLAVFWRDITERKRAGEAKYRTLFESIDEGFCIIEMILDLQGRPQDYRFLEVNPAFERQTGIHAAEGRTMREIAPAHEAHWFETYGRVAATGEGIRFRNRAAQLHRWYDVYAWRHGQPQDRQVAILFNDVTSSVQAEQALRELNESLESRVRERTRQVQDLAGRLTLAELEERRRISQILHDDLQQLLYGIEMKLGLVEAGLPPAEHAPLTANLRDAHAWIAQAIMTTRRLTVDLSPPILQKEGLADALEWLQRQMGELHGLDMTLEVPHAFSMPNQNLRVLLFQVVRELLFNVKKHSGAKCATVRLEEADGRIVIHIIDRGAGLDVEKALGRSDVGGGFGLSSVRERLTLVGGHLVVRSRPGEGTHIEVHAPATPGRSPAAGGADT